MNKLLFQQKRVRIEKNNCVQIRNFVTHFCLCKFNKFQCYIPFYVRNIRRKLHKSISKFTHSRVYILLCDFICDSKNIRRSEQNGNFLSPSVCFSSLLFYFLFYTSVRTFSQSQKVTSKSIKKVRSLK